MFVDSTISSFGDHNYFIPGAGKKSGGEILLIFVWKYWVYLELLFKVSVVWDISISVKCSEYVWGWITGICVWNCADLFIVHKAKHNNNKKKPKIMTHRATSCSTKVKTSTVYYLTMIFLTDWQKIDLIFLCTSSKLYELPWLRSLGKKEPNPQLLGDQVVVVFLPLW